MYSYTQKSVQAVYPNISYPLECTFSSIDIASMAMQETISKDILKYKSYIM